MDEFKPVGELLTYRYGKMYSKKETPITYQYGYVGERYAIQFFIDGKPTAIKLKKTNSRFNFFHDFGAQDIQEARMQREQCLKEIVSHIFEKAGFQVIKEEYKIPISHYTPDLYVLKEDTHFIIELKAYHKTQVCGDPEIEQAIKYYKGAYQDYNEYGNLRNLPSVPNVILMTSGELIDHRKSVNFINLPNRDWESYIKQFYNKEISKIENVSSLDGYEQRKMYETAVSRLNKNIYPLNLEINVSIEFFYDRDEININYIKKSGNASNIIVFSAGALLKLLKNPLYIEKFKLLQETPLENLIIDAEILEM